MRRVDDMTAARILLMRRNGLTWPTIARRTGLSIPTCMKYYKQELKAVFLSRRDGL